MKSASAVLNTVRPGVIPRKRFDHLLTGWGRVQTTPEYRKADAATMIAAAQRKRERKRNKVLMDGVCVALGK